MFSPQCATGISSWSARNSCASLLPRCLTLFCCWLPSRELYCLCLTLQALPSAPPGCAMTPTLNAAGSPLAEHVWVRPLSGEAKRKFDMPWQISYTAVQVLFWRTCFLTCSRKKLSNTNDLFQGVTSDFKWAGEQPGFIFHFQKEKQILLRWSGRLQHLRSTVKYHQQSQPAISALSWGSTSLV